VRSRWKWLRPLLGLAWWSVEVGLGEQAGGFGGAHQQGGQQVPVLPAAGCPGQAVGQALDSGRVELAAGVPPRDVGAVDGEAVVLTVSRGGPRKHVRH